MGIVRVSIYQKTLTDGLNLTILKKLAALKSDFLLLPEYFFADASVRDFKGLFDKSPFALDWLLKLNESYKGVIIGGAMHSASSEGSIIGSPVVYDGQIVDWYAKRNLSPAESSLARAGSENNPFILAGFRFCTLAGADAQDEAAWQAIIEQGVKLIFVLSSDNSFAEEALTDQLLARARQHGLYIAVCCGAGALLGQPASGRSMALTPAGISWRVSPGEKDREILKTVLVNVNEA